MAFKDANTLSSSCSLPQSTGQSISFFAGHSPTPPASTGTTAAASSAGASAGSSVGSTSASPASTQAVSATSGQSSGTTAPASNSGSTSTGGGAASSQMGSTNVLSGTSATNSGTPSSSGNATTSSGSGTSSGLSTGATVGIGVGAGVGGLVFLVAIALLFFRRRRRQRSRTGIESGTDGGKPTIPDMSDAQRVSAISSTPKRFKGDGQPVAEADRRAAQPWSMRAELQGSHVDPEPAELGRGKSVAGNVPERPVGRIGEESSPVAELPGSEGWRPTRPRPPPV